jgi:hypothetical protein
LCRVSIDTGHMRELTRRCMSRDLYRGVLLIELSVEGNPALARLQLGLYIFHAWILYHFD